MNNGCGAQLSVTDLRRVARQTVDMMVAAETTGGDDLTLHLINISTQGFMIDGNASFDRGDRIIVRLPHIGRIEGYCMWVRDERAGFQFERVIRPDDFLQMMDAIEESGGRPHSR